MQRFQEIPVITRTYILLACMTTLACVCDIITPFQLYLAPRLITQNYELWRLATNFFFLC